MKPQTSSRLGAVVVGLGTLTTFSAVATAAIGFAHTPAGRPLLGHLGWLAKSACPVDPSNLSADQLETYRSKTMEKFRGEAPSTSMSADRFVIEQTSRDDVRRWASEKSVTCRAELSEFALRCTSVARGALGGDLGATDAYFRFAPNGRLVALDIMRSSTSSASALEELERIVSAHGSPTRVWGERSTGYLDGQALRQAGASYRYSNYAVDVSATNFGSSLVVREQYRSISTPTTT